MNTLVERYIYQVREHLPEHLRDDVARELQSLILDTLDDRARQRGLTDELVVEVLSELGDPARVAARYQAPAETPARAEWLPLALRCVRHIALAVVLGLAGLWVIMSLVALAVNPGGWRELLSPRQFGEFLFPYAVTVIVNLGLLVGFFAIFGRLLLGTPKPARFDPRRLPPVPAAIDADRIVRGWPLAGVLLSLCALILMNVVPQWFGLLASISDEQGSGFRVIPFAALGLHVPRGIVNLWWLFALALSVALLIQRRWTRLLTLSAICLELVGAGVFFYVAFTSDPALAATPLDVVGRLALLVVLGHGVLLLVCGAVGLWTIIQPAKAPSSMKLA